MLVQVDCKTCVGALRCKLIHMSGGKTRSGAIRAVFNLCEWGGVDMTFGVVHVWGLFSELIFKDSL